jgi:hypothetical protein
MSGDPTVPTSKVLQFLPTAVSVKLPCTEPNVKGVKPVSKSMVSIVLPRHKIQLTNRISAETANSNQFVHNVKRVWHNKSRGLSRSGAPETARPAGCFDIGARFAPDRKNPRTRRGSIWRDLRHKLADDRTHPNRQQFGYRISAHHQNGCLLYGVAFF